jgi:hypothetical protein
MAIQIYIVESNTKSLHGLVSTPIIPHTMVFPRFVLQIKLTTSMKYVECGFKHPNISAIP